MGDCCELDKIQLKIRINMKQEKCKARIKEVFQSHQVTIILNLKNNKYKTIMHERVILTNIYSVLGSKSIEGFICIALPSTFLLKGKLSLLYQ